MIVGLHAFIIVSWLISPSNVDTLLLGLITCLMNYTNLAYFPILTWKENIIKSQLKKVINEKPFLRQSLDYMNG